MLKSMILTIKADIFFFFFLREGSLEFTVKEVRNLLLMKRKVLKKTYKRAGGTTTSKTKSTIEGLSDEQVRQLLKEVDYPPN